MMCAARCVVLAIATLAMDAAAIENEAPRPERAEGAAWEIAWNVALYGHIVANRGENATFFEKRKSPFSRRRVRSDAREVYGNAWVVYRDARVIYEADRERHVTAAGKNFLFALRMYEDAMVEHNAAINAESVARNAAAKAARAIYETGRERNVAAWENYQAVMRMYEDARMKLDAAYKAQRAARNAVRDAVRDATRAARNAVEQANPSGR